MPLTPDELDRLDAAEVERLILLMIEAAKIGDSGPFNAARDRLDEISADPDVDFELRLKAQKAHDQASLEMTSRGLAQMAAIADSIGGAKGGLRAAIEVAESGKQELIFPSLATATAKAEEVFEQFKKAIDAVQDDGAAANQGDVKSRVEAVVASLKTLKGLLPS